MRYITDPMQAVTGYRSQANQLNTATAAPLRHVASLRLSCAGLAGCPRVTPGPRAWRRTPTRAKPGFQTWHTDTGIMGRESQNSSLPRNSGSRIDVTYTRATKSGRVCRLSRLPPESAVVPGSAARTVSRGSYASTGSTATIDAGDRSRVLTRMSRIHGHATQTLPKSRVELVVSGSTTA
jgi:hypothetical protein